MNGNVARLSQPRHVCDKPATLSAFRSASPCDLAAEKVICQRDPLQNQERERRWNVARGSEPGLSQPFRGDKSGQVRKD